MAATADEDSSTTTAPHASTISPPTGKDGVSVPHAAATSAGGGGVEEPDNIVVVEEEEKPQRKPLKKKIEAPAPTKIATFKKEIEQTDRKPNTESESTS